MKNLTILLAIFVVVGCGTREGLEDVGRSSDTEFKPSRPTLTSGLPACLELNCSPTCNGSNCWCWDLFHNPIYCDPLAPLKLCTEIRCLDPICDEGGCYCVNEVERPEYCSLGHPWCRDFECDEIMCPYTDSIACLCVSNGSPSIECLGATSNL